MFNRILIRLLIGFIVAGVVLPGLGQDPDRQGTTAANFLEIGFGSAGCAAGDAYVSLANDLSAVYWNPAGLAFMNQSEAMFNHQPWIVDINTSLAAVGLVFPNIGTVALSFTQMSFGSMEVTTLDMQEGTGELFDAADFAFGLSFGRKLANWFSFGVTAKYVQSRIWHTSANAFGLDFGVLIKTGFFSLTGKREDGLNLGMSIANYGTRIKYDGLDLINSIDILPDESGNYSDVPGKFQTEAWELPLIFRVGVSWRLLSLNNYRAALAIDALHPNNNTESVNVGMEHNLFHPTLGSFFIRFGYKGIFLEDSEFGPTFGMGMVLRMMRNIGIKVEYAYRNIGILGNVHSYGFGILF